MSYRWRNFTIGEEVPKNAVQITEQSSVYMGRVMYGQEINIVTYSANDQKAYITFYEKVIQVYEFEILLNLLPKYKPAWSKTIAGDLPKNAIEIGFTKTEDSIPSYVARVYHNNNYVPAKYIASYRQAYYVDGEKEGTTTEFEVLVSRIDGYDWIGCTKSSIPENYFVVGKDEDKDDIGVGYTFYKNEKTLVKLVPAKATASVAYYQKEYHLTKDDIIHVLVQNITTRSFIWKTVTTQATFPKNDVVKVGHNDSGEIFYVGRYLKKTAYYPGKVVKMRNTIYFPCNGNEETRTENFDVLTFPLELKNKI